MFEDMNEINDLMGRSYASPDGIDEVSVKLKKEDKTHSIIHLILLSLIIFLLENLSNRLCHIMRILRDVTI